MFGLGMTELLVILAIVLLVLGPRRLKSFGSDLGSAIKGFRTAVADEEKGPEVDAKVIHEDGDTNTTSKTSETSDQGKG
ncbi:MAG TPA: twin-arginine translocase subunit TatA [Gammaproteobacteria bacterium]|jgi:sec-independent protein translocase protein TatA|nr:MAG: twin-arginine translocase TatA/TatE family subunit [OM182 bacterium]HAL41028.1 twin-arginine translocase subunit TatA [Gammaproteobacteria bacterium]HBK18622.1 twin-arginine translocase subunit TatA [Gammaproteobacteria bacterium]